jgi:ABC-type multidrug transport system ATPase subunit
MAIGYGQPIARIDSDIFLAQGTHFLLARNGRGKTTLLRTLARTLKSVAGRFHREGYTQYLPEDLRFDPFIPAKSIFRSLLPASRVPDALALSERIELDLGRPYGKLSTGNRRKISLIVAEYSVRPDTGNILLLDEPFSGLDAYARNAFEEIWKNSADNVLRLVSCHPDYDSMAMPSALLIHDEKISHTIHSGQTWTQLKDQLN